MPVIYALNTFSRNPYNVLNGGLPLDVRVQALEDAVTQLQKQVTKLQGMINMMQQAQEYGYCFPGLASFQILSEPGMSNVVIPFFH